MKVVLLAMVVLAAGQPGGVEIVARDNNSNVEKLGQSVARQAAEWESLWRSHAGPAKPAPKIDFSKRTVVAVFLGSRPTAGYGIEVLGTRPEGKTLVVEWRESRPEKGMMLAQVLTSPALIVSIPKFDGEIKFQKVDP